MKFNSHSMHEIEVAIKDFAKKYSKSHGKPTSVTDIHFQPKVGTGELIIFDDDDNEISKAVIEEWMEYGDDYYENIEKCLISALSKAKENGMFDDISILTPYSFVLVDEDKETVSDLLIMDDDTLLVNDELLKGLDKELDDFLKELLNV